MPYFQNSTTLTLLSITLKTSTKRFVKSVEKYRCKEWADMPFTCDETKGIDAKYEDSANSGLQDLLYSPVFIDDYKKPGHLPSQTAMRDVRERIETQKWMRESRREMHKLFSQVRMQYHTKSVLLTYFTRRMYTPLPRAKGAMFTPR